MPQAFVSKPRGGPAGGLALGLLMAPALAAAQAPPAAAPAALPAPVASAPASLARPPVAADPARVPAGTIVRIRIDTDLSSKTARRGDRFPIVLAEDVMLDGRVMLPAGIRGEGEVVHAAGTGFGGRAGELLLAARFLDHGGARIPLRGLKLGLSGEDQASQAMVATMVFAPVGLLVTGTSVQVMAGQLAEAKLAQPVPLPPAEPPVSSPATPAAPALPAEPTPTP